MVDPVTPRRRFTWRHALCAGATVGLLLALAVEVRHTQFGTNLHCVVPGRVFRSRQLAPTVLEQTLTERGIRTLVNLRGCCDPFPWYLDECRTTHRLGVSQEDVCLSAGRLPSVDEVRYLVKVLDHCDYPVMFHCRQGADRTGLASTLALLLHTDTSLPDALGQLGTRYGHIALGRTAYIDMFFTLYEEWLERQSLQHAPAHFRAWLERDYCPGECRCRLEVLDLPDEVPLDKVWTVRVRAHNTSVRPWQFRSSRTHGIHGGFGLVDARGMGVDTGRTGLLDRTVATGESIDLVFPMRALREPGSYYLLLDLVDEQHCWFCQAGSEPILHEVRAK